MTASHLGDELSALLDGELGADETAAVHAHLDACASCRDDLDALRQVRERLRTAPPVDPPFGFYERLLSGRRRARWPVVAAVAAVAAAWVVVLGFVASPGPDRATPRVDALRSVAAGQAVGVSLHKVEPVAVHFPNQVAGHPRVTTFRAALQGGESGDGATFGNDPSHVIVVFVYRGRVDWGSLVGGLRRPVDGLPGNPWRSVAPGAMPAIVVQDDATTIVVTGNVDEDTLEEAARELGNPEPPSALDHLRDAAQALTDAFGLNL